MSTAAKPSSSLPRIPELDGVRGIAALLVFFHHATLLNKHLTGWSHLQTLSMTFWDYGGYGVDVFFVLSGFLITSMLIKERQSPAFYRDFYWKRALRVLPLYFTVLLGILLFIPHSAVTVAFAASFLMSFATTLPSVLKNPFWTLAIEEQFYILWPAVVRRRSTTQLARFAIGVAVASFVLRLLFAVKGHYNYFLTPLRCDGLALGALLACRFDGRQRGELPARSDDRGLFLTLLGGVAFLLISILTPHSGRATAFAAAFEVSAVTLLCCAFIGFLIGHTGGRSVAIFRSPVLTFFGLISYAFYLLHFYVLYAYDRIRGPLVPGDTRGFFLRIAIAFAVTTILCLVSRYLIELPALSLRRYVLLRPTRPAETELPLTHAN